MKVLAAIPVLALLALALWIATRPLREYRRQCRWQTASRLFKYGWKYDAKDDPWIEPRT